MSTGQANEKKSKGKQKIEMKKVKSYGDRMITFSKRKSGIHKKLHEIVTMCDANVALLVFSQAGKPYTFVHPSMEDVAGRLKNLSGREPLTKKEDTAGLLVEAYKKRKDMDLLKKYVAVVENLDMEKEKEKVLKESENEMELENMWWNRSLKGLSTVELEERNETFTELYDSLCEMAISRSGKSDEDSSSGRG